MRSRSARGTSTGETALVAISRASSVIEAKNRSAISDRPIVCRRLGVADGDRLQGAHEPERRLDLEADVFQLGVRPGEAREPRAATEGIEVNGVVHHGGKNTGRPGVPASCSRWKAPLGILEVVTRRRVLWLVLALVVVVAGAAASLALLALPRLAREAAVWQLTGLTGRPVTIEALDLDLARGEFSVRGFR